MKGRIPHLLAVGKNAHLHSFQGIENILQYPVVVWISIIVLSDPLFVVQPAVILHPRIPLRQSILLPEPP